jgi:uncharacterized integral membrane protein
MMDNPMMETNEQQPGARRKIGWGWIAAGLLILAFLLVVAVQLVKTQQGTLVYKQIGPFTSLAQITSVIDPLLGP